MVDFGFHALHAWSREEDMENTPTGGCYNAGQCTLNIDGAAAKTPGGYSGFPDGSLSIIGADFAVRNTIAGEFYVGFSHIGASNAWVVDDVVEPIHSGGGGEFRQGIVGNYLESSNLATPSYTAGSKGDGHVDTLLLQYDFSLANLMSNLAHKGQFWGDGPDLTLSYFMMYNSVYSLDPNLGKPGNGGKESKLKFGFDLIGTPLKWLGAGFRFDDLMPNNENSNQSFMILSPHLIFKTAFVTHEQINLTYSRYIYAQRYCPLTTDTVDCVQAPPATVQPNGFGNPGEYNTPPGRGAPTKLPDENVIQLSATMWW
jgi:hypothetical protein